MRVLIVTSASRGVAVDCIPELMDSESVELVAVVRVAGMNPATRWRRRARKLRKVLRIGPLGAVNGMRLRAWYRPDSRSTLDEVCERFGLALHHVPYIGSEETARVVGQAGAELGLSLGNSYIPRRVFTLFSHGMINLHTERLPEYQGARAIIWPIFNRERTTGLTLHRVNDGIDTGDILWREEFPILFRPTLEQTVLETMRETWRRTPPAVRHVCENFFELSETSIRQAPGRAYTTPSIWQYFRMVRNNREIYHEINSGTAARTAV